MHPAVGAVGRGLRAGGSWFTRQPWWAHVLITLGVVIVVEVIALVALTASVIDIEGENRGTTPEVPRQSLPDRAERLDLAGRFAPILKLARDELFVPIDRPAYIGDTQLKQEEGKFVKVVDPTPTAAHLPFREGTCLRVRGCTYFLDVRGVEPDPPTSSARAYDALENHLLRQGAKPTVYAHVTRYDDTGDYAVQYWFLYFFNYRLNEHESDWEQITLRLDEDRKPVDAFYSAHAGGRVLLWKRIEHPDGEHPVVYVALGSHANYFRPGPHRVLLGCKRVVGSVKACLKEKVKPDLADGRGRELQVGRDYGIRELTGPVFVGSYGSGNYVILTRKPDILSDPRRRAAWLDPLASFR